LYTSIVIKGKASIVSDNQEKAFAMNKMMQKYQSEGKYTKLNQSAKSIIHLTVIKINVDTINGKYKIGQEWSDSFKKDIANKIIQKEGITKAREILKSIKIIIQKNGELELPNSVNLEL
jgi:predicted FMN-binding regulatory protein PaiB